MNAITSAPPSRLRLVTPDDPPNEAPDEAPDGGAALQIIVTAFASPDAAQGTENAWTWGDFVRLIQKDPPAFAPATLAPPVDGKYAKPATLTGFSLVQFKDAYRAGANVLKVFAAGLDYDGTRDMADVLAVLKREGLEAVAHTTFNDTGDHRRFRVFVLLGSTVDAAGYAHTWARLNELLGGGADANAKDAARFWYGPGIIAGRAYHHEHVEGRPLDVATLPEGVTRPAPTRPVAAPSPADYATELDAQYGPAAGIVGAALLAQCPTTGQRHDVCATLAGALASKAFGPSSSGYLPAGQIAAFVTRAAEHAGFGALSNKYAFAADTVTKKQRGENVTGWPKLSGAYPMVSAAVDEIFSTTSKAAASEGIAAAFGTMAAANDDTNTATDDPTFERIHESTTAEPRKTHFERGDHAELAEELRRTYGAQLVTAEGAIWAYDVKRGVWARENVEKRLRKTIVESFAGIPAGATFCRKPLSFWVVQRTSPEFRRTAMHGTDTVHQDTRCGSCLGSGTCHKKTRRRHDPASAQWS